MLRLAFVVLLGLLAAQPAPAKRGPRPGAPQVARAAARAKGQGGAAAGKGGKDMALARANGFLKQGSPRASIASFKRQLQANPDSVAAHVGLGRALARIGRCDEALDNLEPYVGMKSFGGEAALAAGTCAGRLGFLEEAVYYNQLAVELDEKSARAWTSLALAYDELGDVAERDAALDELLVLRDNKDASWYAEGVIAIRRGDLDELDRIALLWRRDDRSNLDLVRLLALSWLDQDDPVAAFDTLATVKVIRAGTQIRSLRAESLRRMGFAESAMLYLEDRPQSVLEGPDADAVKVRVLADLGRLDEARAVLDEYEGTLDDPDLLASAWYVAHVTGDAAAEQDAAQKYEGVRQSPLRDLGQLVPLPKRPPA